MADDRGLSTIELVTAVFILGILAATAVLTQIGVVDRGRAATGDASLNRVATAQVNFAARWGTYSPSPADLPAVTGTTVVTGVSTAEDEVSIAVGDRGSFAAVVLTAEGCMSVRVPPLDAGPSAARFVERQLSASQVCVGSSALPPNEAAVPAESVTP